MGLQGIGLRKTLLTYGAFERSFPRVRAQMDSQITRLIEGSRAEETLVWFFSTVNTHVDFQCGRTQKHSLAFLAR